MANNAGVNVAELANGVTDTVGNVGSSLPGIVAGATSAVSGAVGLKLVRGAH